MKKMVFPQTLLIWCVWSLSGCLPDADLLPGKWLAAAFYEDNKTVHTPLDSVSLRFTDEGLYEFRSLGSYRETGQYRVAGAYLFLTDTTRRPPKEHTIKILYLSDDTLKVLMANEKKRQALFLGRVQ